MSLEIALRLIAGFILLGLNAFFVASEFALTRLRQYSRDEVVDSPAMERAWKMTETLELYLTGCQIGITSTSIILGVVAEPAVTALFEMVLGGLELGWISSYSISIVLSVILINFIHTVWGEQTPTYLGVEKAKAVSRYCAYPLYWWNKMIYPVLYLGDSLTKGTLRLFGIQMKRSWLEGPDEEPSKADIRSEIANLLKTEGVPRDRRKEVMKALEIDEIPVEQIMVPREKIITLSTKRSLAENLRIIYDNMHARYPLIEDSLEEFKGILYTPEILGNIEALKNGEKELDDFDWPKMTVSSDLPVSHLIDRFQQQHHELALVTNNGRVLGLVTLTDALEVIVGSVEDPLDLAG
ncbi:MAG: hemolysin family protein [Balneolaceae bacterium]|nr:hemolysin family protein [Balneolaceae bacterium]